MAKARPEGQALGEKGEYFLDRIGSILVVAPKQSFLQSIAFALEAEGFGVEGHALLASALSSPLAETADCVVIDDHAVNGANGGWEALSRFKLPIVLLCNHLPSMPERPGITVLLKPLLGRSLTDTVMAAVAQRQPSGTPLRTTT